MIIKDQKDVTAAVLSEIARAPDPRFREILSAFVRHLHDFAREVHPGLQVEAAIVRGLRARELLRLRALGVELLEQALAADEEGREQRRHISQVGRERSDLEVVARAVIVAGSALGHALAVSRSGAGDNPVQ